MGFLPFTPKASPIVFGLLWASLQDYPPTHPLVAQTTAIFQYMSAALLLISRQNSLSFVPAIYLYLTT